MTKVKMSLANVQGKLSRSEMKEIIAGEGYQGIIGDGDCLTEGTKCSKGDTCCGTLICYNKDGESGSFRCNK
jgi:hypothetical protein